MVVGAYVCVSLWNCCSCTCIICMGTLSHGRAPDAKIRSFSVCARARCSKVNLNTVCAEVAFVCGGGIGVAIPSREKTTTIWKLLRIDIQYACIFYHTEMGSCTCFDGKRTFAKNISITRGMRTRRKHRLYL